MAKGLLTILTLASFITLSAFYSEPADIQIPDDEVYGIKRINILIGPRVYF